MPIPNDNRLYTAADYMAFEGEERWELIGGAPLGMAPAPGLRHQSVLLNLGIALSRLLKDGECKPFIAPVDVILSEHDVVQPDALVVSDPEKTRRVQCIDGPPDLVFEILSPGSQQKDRWTKKPLYERSAIREYIIIDPEGESAERFVLGEDGRYPAPDRFGRDGEIPLASLDGVSLRLERIFRLPFRAGHGPEGA